MADAGWHDEDAPRVARAVASDDPAVPAGPDPARDARIDAYRDRERRRAVRALDRFIDLNMNGGAGTTAADVAGDRFVEAVGDYVLARLAESSDRDVAFGLHQKADYGVPDSVATYGPDES